MARGRDAVIFEYGRGLVLRRYRDAHDTLREAAVMQLARVHGVPVPAVHAVRATDMVLERVDGPTLLDWAVPSPRRLRTAARILAELHDQVHAVAAPDWLPTPLGEGTSLLHLDLHPLNVLMTASGPVVIDWTNARRGPPAADVALTWVIMATSEVPGALPLRLLVASGRRLFVRWFLSHFDASEVRAMLAVAAEARVADRNVTDHERARVRSLLARHT